MSRQVETGETVSPWRRRTDRLVKPSGERVRGEWWDREAAVDRTDRRKEMTKRRERMETAMKVMVKAAKEAAKRKWRSWSELTISCWSRFKGLRCGDSTEREREREAESLRKRQEVSEQEQESVLSEEEVSGWRWRWCRPRLLDMF